MRALCCCTVILCCAFSGSAQTSAETLAVVGGEPVYANDAMAGVQAQILQLRNQQYEIQRRALDNAITQKALEQEAKRRGLSKERLLEQEVDSQIGEAGEAELRGFYLGQKDRLNRPFEEVRSQLASNLRQLKIQQARQDYLADLRAKANVIVLLRPPKVDVSYDAARLKGAGTAPITIVEFTDFQCPYCRNAQDTLRGLLQKYGDKVSLAFRDFPLRSIHPQAQAAAEAARCAGEQGRFWEYHDLLYQNQTTLGPDTYPHLAEKAKLDVSQFRACVAAGKYRAQIDADVRDGTRLGVNGTPAFFINGTFLNGAVPASSFENIIDQELADLRGRAKP